MEFRVRVHINDRSQRQELTEAFGPWQQLGNMTEASDEDKQALENASGRFGRKGWSQDFDRDTIAEGMRCLRLLRAELEVQSKAQADPEWVRQTKELEAKGGVPFVKDPEAAIEMIHEIRRRQIRSIDRALLILAVALQGLENLDAQVQAATENAQNLSYHAQRVG